MTLTIYFDGTYWYGLLEFDENQKVRLRQHLFGSEPNAGDIAHFLNHEIHDLLNEKWYSDHEETVSVQRKMNPKRLSRMIRKDVSRQGISSKSQDILKQELEAKKMDSLKARRQAMKVSKEERYHMRRNKAKQKKRGH